jgi:2-polyprenyl-3-methyl-5-hydroxy-6-metoxy-1,4-benzoquinol methylase
MASNLDDINEHGVTTRLDKYTDKIESKRKTHRKKLGKFDKYRHTGRLLEIGCNAGALLAAARDMGWEVSGVDLSSTASEYARTQLGLDVFTGTVEEAAYPDDYFDVIYSHAVLEHVRHPLSMLKECKRIMRPGGVFYADTVNWDSYTRRILGAGWRLLYPVSHVHLYTPRNVESLCQYAGLEHVTTRTTGIRVRANAENSTFHTPWYLNLAKGPLSALTRITNKGDSIEFTATKK